MEDLEEAIRCHREALALRPLGNPDRSKFLSGLADSVFTRFRQSGRKEDSEEAIAKHLLCALTVISHLSLALRIPCSAVLCSQGN